MKRLVRKAEHDWHNRDTAIVVFGDKIYENVTHGICLQEYLKDNKSVKRLELGMRPDVEVFQKASKDNNGQDVILAHKVNNYDTVYYIYGYHSGEKMSNEQIESSLKKLFPDKKIVNDLDHVDDGNNEGYNKDEKLEKGYEAVEQYSDNMTDNEELLELINSHTELQLNINSTEDDEYVFSNKEVSIVVPNSYEGNEISNFYNIDFKTVGPVRGIRFSIDNLDVLLDAISSIDFETSKLLEENGWTFYEVYNKYTFIYKKDGFEVDINALEENITFNDDTVDNNFGVYASEVHNLQCNYQVINKDILINMENVYKEFLENK